MKNNYKFVVTISLLLSLSFTLSAITLKPVKLADNHGGYIDGRVWKSDFLLGKTNIIIYADPDEFSDMKKFVENLKKEKSKNNNFGLTFIINTEATMIPTFMIKSRIKKKAKESPSISYVLDNDKILVDKWMLQDDAVNVLLLDSLNEINYQKTGKMTITQLKEIINKIKDLK